MSLVGPRPALPSQTALNLGRKEHGVEALRPGITGWAQINGRDDLTDEEKLSRDMEYLLRQSLILDVSIIGRTIVTIFTGKGNK